MVRFSILVVLLGCLNTYTPAAELSFNQDIRSILSDNCFACHGPDEHARQAELRLDDRQSAMDAGALTPGNADDSEIINRIVSRDPELLMPPSQSAKTLKPSEFALLRRWVHEGAEYQPHWSFVPIPKHVDAPELGGGSSWAHDELDRFVLPKLIEQGMEPAVEAERAQWLRRVSFDLIGLPPSLEQRERFLNDKSPDAFEKIVDELLASQSNGERMANMWHDVAR